MPTNGKKQELIDRLCQREDLDRANGENDILPEARPEQEFRNGQEFINERQFRNEQEFRKDQEF